MKPFARGRMFGGWAAALAAALGLGLLSCAQSNAQPPGAGEVKTVQGKVKSFTTAPRGEVDGAVLEDGTVIHWPPHLEDRFRGILTRGERIRVTGRQETSPEGDTHLEVQSVTNLRTKASRENNEDAPPPPPARRAREREDAPPPPRGPRPPHHGRPAPRPEREEADARTVEGKVKSLTTAPGGEVDGAVLEDGTVIHWPPHLQDRYRDIADRGNRVRVTGFMETGPEGDARLEVQSMKRMRGAAERGPDKAEKEGTPRAERRLQPSGPRPADASRADPEERIRALEKEVEQLKKEMERLRRNR